MLTYLADFALGLFVGVYALASFSPAEIAREVYRTCWFFCGGFVLLAYGQHAASGPSARGVLRGSSDTLSFFGLSGLELTVIAGIAIAFVGGQYYLKRFQSEDV